VPDFLDALMLLAAPVINLAFIPIMLLGDPLIIAFIALCSYLCGSIPFGLILTKLFNLGDIRAIGSGNIGATNVLRTGNKKIAAATLALDMLKGFVPTVLILREYSTITGDALGDAGYASIIFTSALCVLMGHIFPVWLKFKGGKGVATYLGIVLAHSWPLFIVAIVIWLLVAIIFRYSSLAALVTALVLPIIIYTRALLERDFQDVIVFSIILASAVILFLTHKENIIKLRRGTESRIGKPR